MTTQRTKGGAIVATPVLWTSWLAAGVPMIAARLGAEAQEPVTADQVEFVKSL
jgi:hypothetical protein